MATTFLDTANVAASKVQNVTLNPGDTSLSIDAVDQALFPAAAFPLVIAQKATLDGNGNFDRDTVFEIMKVTAGFGTATLTITRAQEGTSARTFTLDDPLYVTHTALTITEIHTAVIAVEDKTQKLGSTGSFTADANPRVGIGLTTPGDDLNGGTTDIGTENLLHIYGAAVDATLLLEGDTAKFYMSDIAGAANTKMMLWEMDAAELTLDGLNDDLTIASANIIRFAHTTGEITMGYAVKVTNNFTVNTDHFFVDSTKTSAHIGVDITTPGDNLAGSTSDVPTADSVLHVYNGAGADAWLIVEGDFPRVDWIDLAGGADDKWMHVYVNGGVMGFSSLVDLGTARITDMLTLDLGTGAAIFGFDLSAAGDFAVNTADLFVDTAETAAHVGIGIATPGDNLAGSTFDVPTGEAVMHIYRTGADAWLIIEGDFARLDMIDLAGAADDKWATIDCDGGRLRFSSLDDDGTNRLVDFFTLDLGDGHVRCTGDLDVSGGDIAAGVNSTTRGVLSCWDGAGSNTPGTLVLYALDGTPYYLFVESDGTLKIHTSLPTADADGDIVGQQN